MITLRKADPDPDRLDSRRIWEWRQDPVTRSMSRATEPVPWASHRAFYAKAAIDPNRAILIAEVDGAAACMVRFDDLTAPCSEISINMCPAQRGKGQGKPILAAACAYGFAHLGLGRIQARIKLANLPSIKIFEGVGFVFQGERDDLLTYHLSPNSLIY